MKLEEILNGPVPLIKDPLGTADFVYKSLRMSTLPCMSEKSLNFPQKRFEQTDPPGVPRELKESDEKPMQGELKPSSGGEVFI